MQRTPFPPKANPDKGQPKCLNQLLANDLQSNDAERPKMAWIIREEAVSRAECLEKAYFFGGMLARPQKGDKG